MSHISRPLDSLIASFRKGLLCLNSSKFHSNVYTFENWGQKRSRTLPTASQPPTVSKLPI